MRQRGRLGSAPVILDGARRLGDAVELRPLREELADLEVRIDARLDAAEDLEQEPVVEQDGRVALLGGPADDLQGHALRPAGPAKADVGRPRISPLRVRVARPSSMAVSSAQQATGSARASYRTASPVEAVDRGDDPPRRLPDQPRRILALGQAQRQEVDLRLPLAMADLDQREEARRREALGLARVDQPQALELPCLARVPALLAEECGECLALDAAPGRGLEQGFPYPGALRNRHGLVVLSSRKTESGPSVS